MGYQLSQCLTSLSLLPKGSALPELALTPNSTICDSSRRDDRIVPGQPRSFSTSTPLCLLSRKWHTRLGKPAWFHLRALAFSHAPASDWPNWQAVTTKSFTELTNCRYPSYLLMLGWQNQFSHKFGIVGGGLLWICLLWKKRKVTYMVYGCHPQVHVVWVSLQFHFSAVTCYMDKSKSAYILHQVSALFSTYSCYHSVFCLVLLLQTVHNPKIVCLLS